MITIRPSDERGRGSYDWLETRHTFSFSTYRDPRHVGFHALVVINEDHIAPGGGFGMHHHDNMEILTYVISGQLEHKDSMGNGSIIRAGDVQYMSAGTGVEHSEYNPSSSQPVHLLQMWLLPDERDAKPRYDQRHFADVDRSDGLLLLASDDQANGGIRIRSHTKLYASVLKSGETLRYTLQSQRAGWLQLISGCLEVNGHSMKSGDGARIEAERELTLTATETCAFLLYDLSKTH